MSTLILLYWQSLKLIHPWGVLYKYIHLPTVSSVMPKIEFSVVIANAD